MPLTVLSHSQLRSLLLSLTRDEITSIQRDLAEALREYSTGNQNQGCSASYQPRRTAITRLNGCTTLFMPASTGQTMGIKMTSLQDWDEAGSSVETGLDASETAPSGARNDNVSANSSRSGPRDSTTSLSSDQSEGSTVSQDESSSISASVQTASGSINERGLSETMGGWPGAGTRDTSPNGSVTLLDAEGLPFGLINALELSAFRTALSSLMLFSKRKHVRTLTVFGAGRQAYWHIRLALILRGSDIKRVYIINRSFERVTELLKAIYSPENTSWRGNVKFSAVSSDFVEYRRILTESVHKADAILCCTPSVEPLFPSDLLTSKEGRRKGRYVCAVGSYKAHMAELHPDILRDEVNLQSHHRHFHKYTRPSGVIVVDSLGAATKEAGEVVQAEIRPQQVVELGELLMVREATRKESAVDNGLQHSNDDQREKEEKSLRKWIQSGNIIYKSVGLGLMDVVTGGQLVNLARDRGVGTLIEDF